MNAAAYELIAPAGEALYVWGAYVACAVGLAMEVGLLALRRRNIVDYLRRLFRPAG
jgi:heme exporter protein CcmD